MNKNNKKVLYNNSYQKYFPLMIFLCMIFMSVGYAVINNVQLDIDGIAISKSTDDVFITSVVVVDSKSVNLNESKIIYSYENLFNSSTTLSKTDSDSFITYKITLYNSSDQNKYYLGATFDDKFNTNPFITYTITGIAEQDIIAPKEYKDILVKFHYKDNKIPQTSDANYISDYNIATTYISFVFESMDIEVVETIDHNIYDINQKVPIVLTNNNSYDIDLVVSYNGEELTDVITIPANKVMDIIQVDLSGIYNSLQNGKTFYLDLEITTPIKYSVSKAATFIKETTPIKIINIEEYINDQLVTTDNYSYTENSLVVENKGVNKKYSYKVTVKNFSSMDVYKLRNITDVVNSDTSFNHTTDINIADGILIKPLQELTFYINYDYGSSSSVEHSNIVFFDFRWNYSFQAVDDQLITISTPETNTDSRFGDFSAITSSTTMLSDNCTFSSCYSDNNGLLEYDSMSGLVLDSNNQILVLNIDQSMSVANAYTLYLTVKADTNQEGIPTKNFPGTIIAISEASTKYLSWLGFYKNYLHIYAYYSGTAQSKIAKDYNLVGFTSFNVSKYSGKIINIQISSVRGGNTRVFINGELVHTFQSGSSPIDYISATIGDLRTGRGLKYTGTIYDLGMYNRELTDQEIMTNWEYAREKWSITN